ASRCPCRVSCDCKVETPTDSCPWAFFYSLRQTHADDFLVVSHKHAPVGERGVNPHHLPPAAGVRRVDDVRPTHLLVPPGAEPGDDEVALFVEQEVAVLVLDEEGVAPPLGLVRAVHVRDLLRGERPARGPHVLPDPLAGLRLDAAQLPVAT